MQLAHIPSRISTTLMIYACAAPAVRDEHAICACIGTACEDQTRRVARLASLALVRTISRRYDS